VDQPQLAIPTMEIKFELLCVFNARNGNLEFAKRSAHMFSGAGINIGIKNKPNQQVGLKKNFSTHF
jgi:hypothetical protein